MQNLSDSALPRSSSLRPVGAAAAGTDGKLTAPTEQKSRLTVRHQPKPAEPSATLTVNPILPTSSRTSVQPAVESRTPDGKGGWLEDVGGKGGRKAIAGRKLDTPADGPIAAVRNPVAATSVVEVKMAAGAATDIMKSAAGPSRNPSMRRPVSVPPGKPIQEDISAELPANSQEPLEPDAVRPIQDNPPGPPEELLTELPPLVDGIDVEEGKEKKKKKKKDKKDKEHKKHRRKTFDTAMASPTETAPIGPIAAVPKPVPIVVESDVIEAPPTVPDAVVESPTTTPTTEDVVPAEGAVDEPIKTLVVRPALDLSPSDAAAFEKPDPVAELGPIRKPLPVPPKRAAQTVLTMMPPGMNRRKFGQTSTVSVIPKPMLSANMFGSELVSDNRSKSGSAAGSVYGSAAALSRVRSTTSSTPLVAAVVEVLAAEDEKLANSLPQKKPVKKKKEKKQNKEKKKRELQETLSEGGVVAVDASKTDLRNRNAQAAAVVVPDNDIAKAPPPDQPTTDEANEREEEQEQGSRRRKKRTKKKDGNASDEEEKKKRRKKKRHDSAPHYSQNAGSKKDDGEVSAKPDVPPPKVDELWGKAVGNFFILEDILGKGGFGEARRGRHITTGKRFAIKLERIVDANDSLAEEYKIYQLLGQRTGFPRCYYFGTGPAKNNALVMDLLGPSLEDYYRAMERKWSLKTICMVALQVLERIEYVHSKGYVYSDIKPENFLVGLAEEKQDGIIYLIDFGLAQQFKDKETGKYCYDENLKTHPVGTMRYMSVRSHEARSLSYRDDLESIGYLIVYLIRGRLPWQGMAMKDRQKKVKMVGLQKKNMTVEELCQDCPSELQDYMKYVRSIQFYAEPKYERLRTFFHNVLTQNKWVDDGVMDWVGNVYDFGKNKKSESIIGGGVKVASGPATAEEGAEKADKVPAKPKLATNEDTKDGKDAEVADEPKKAKKKKKPKKEKVPKAPAVPEVLAPLIPAKKEVPGLNTAPMLPRTPIAPANGLDPSVDPIITFTEKEAERPLRPSSSSATENTARENMKRERAKHNSSCNCC